jgi:hypothetical protein
MRSNIFAGVLKVVGIPVFLVKWILKAIWFLTYGFVGLLYKASFISGSKSGKIAYTIASTTLLIGVILIVCFIKK